MDFSLLQVVIAAETDIVQVRSRTRRLAELVGFDLQDQTRITTAVSEIARNTYEYARGGRISFRLTGETRYRNFEIFVRDRGPGIPDLDAVLSGTRKSPTGMGIGLVGARRLMDDFEIVSKPGEGTIVRMRKALPTNAAPITPATIKSISAKLAADGPPMRWLKLPDRTSKYCCSWRSCVSDRRTWSG